MLKAADMNTYVRDNTNYLFSVTNFTQLYDSTLSSSQATFDITSISQAYNHLQLEAYLRGDNADSNNDCNVKFNNDGAGNYDFVKSYGTNGSPVSASGNGTAGGPLGNRPGANAGANLFSHISTKIAHYTNTANNKEAVATWAEKDAASAAGLSAGVNAVFWRSNAAISRITLFTSGNFVAGSRVTLYGLL